MSEPSDLSEAKRALLEKYLRGDLSPAANATDADQVSTELDASEPPGCVVPIHTDGHLSPFFFLHGQWETSGFFCYPLARALGPDRPFYALDPYRFDGVPPPFRTIAATHLESIRAIAPDGPYVLGGWCNGALLAYEMARQLHAEGQEIDQVVLMDPVYLEYPARLRFVRATIRRIGKLIVIGENKQLEFYLWLRQVYRYLQHVKTYLRSRDYRRSNRFAGLAREDYPGVYDWTAMGYRPTSDYPGKVTILWSATQPFRRGWRRFEAANDVEVDVLPCRHMTCLNEYLDHLAARVRTSLAGVSSSPASGEIKSTR